MEVVDENIKIRIEVDWAEILKKWNPWWIFGRVPENKTNIIRGEILRDLKKFISIKEIFCITGVRRCGKSTLLYQVIDFLINEKIDPKNILYFNLDEPFGKRDIHLLDSIYSTFLELNNPHGRKYIFFDEIQNIDGWEKWLKKYYDQSTDEIKFVITGSNSSMLRDSLSRLLTGRMIAKTIYPLSFKEYLEFKNFGLKDKDYQKEEIRYHFSKYLQIGGFPEVVLEEDDDINRERLKEYFDSIVLRDIVVSRKIREASKLTDLVRYLATNISNPISYNKISSAINLNINSIKEYLNYCEQAYLLFQLGLFSYSFRESVAIQKPKKIYCIDNGLRNSASMVFSKDEGRLAENLVFLELKRRGKEIYFWKGKNEIDFVVREKNNILTVINVCYSDSINEREIKSLIEFKNEFKRQHVRLIILTRDTRKVGEGIEYIPLWRWVMEQWNLKEEQ